MAEPEGTADFEEQLDDVEDLTPETPVEDLDPARTKAALGYENVEVTLDPVGVDVALDSLDIDDDVATASVEVVLDSLAIEEDLDPEIVEEVQQEPPRRRLVSELLDGQEEVADNAKSGLQLVAPPIHIETIDAGQPVYQLDLSSDEPEGRILEPEVDPRAEGNAMPAAAVATDPVSVAGGRPESAVEGHARAALKQLITNRDRQVMAAERDGLGAYELAVGIDGFVDEILRAARQSDD